MNHSAQLEEALNQAGIPFSKVSDQKIVATGPDFLELRHGDTMIEIICDRGSYGFSRFHKDDPATGFDRPDQVFEDLDAVMAEIQQVLATLNEEPVVEAPVVSKFTSEAHKSLALAVLNVFPLIGMGVRKLQKDYETAVPSEASTRKSVYQAGEQYLQSVHDELIHLFFEDAIEHGKVAKEDSGAGFGLCWYDFATTGTEFGRMEAIRLVCEEYDLDRKAGFGLFQIANHRLSKPFLEASRDKAQEAAGI